MKRIIITALGALLSLHPGSAFAATCKEQAAEKKLAGAAFNSFMGKCRKDAQAACDKSSAEMQLIGVAKTSHTKKCIDDTVGK